MEENELKQECLKLVESVEWMYLGTNGDDGTPQIRMMSNMRCSKSCTNAPRELFAGHADDFTAYMITSHSSNKMEQIRTNSKVSLYYCDPQAFHTFLLIGTAEEVADMELKKLIWQEEWKMHWPGGPEDPEFVLLQMQPKSAKGWYKEGPFEFEP